jgi:hypothetical protein
LAQLQRIADAVLERLLPRGVVWFVEARRRRTWRLGGRVATRSLAACALVWRIRETGPSQC